ncbi:UNVERIFIED_CONTAM: hypothetical protein HDU68_011137 [Siphonaria sp. JEL0065]|nr:hypothetical protein HDU68_011137 [Siphonaria sp. JEL0065]
MNQDAGSFTAKRTMMDWDLISRINIDRMLKNEAKLDEELESLYPLLVSASISEADARATPESLVKLFRLSQFVMELKNMFLEGAESQIEKMEDTIKSQETEISKLKSRAGATPSAELRMLRQENLDLERRNELLTRDLQRLEENLAKEVKYGQEVGAALSEEKARYMTLSETTHELQNEMKEREVQMVSQRHRLLSKNIEEEEFRAQLKDKNLEINKYLSEIKSLTTQNSQLSAEVDTIGQELEATVAEIERNSSEMEEMHDIIKNNDVLLEQLTEERDTLKIKVEEMHDRLQVKGKLSNAHTDEVIESLHKDVEYLKKLVAEADASNISYRNQIDRMNEELGNMKRSTFTVNEDALRLEIREKDEVIENLRIKLEESYKDFQVLSLDWDRIDSLVKDKAGGEIEGLKSQAALAARLREKITLFKERHTGDTEKRKELEKQLEEKETELISLRNRMESYEKGVFGLKESIRESKQLKLEKSIRDKEISTLAKKINDFEQQVSDFVEENEELRAKLGMKSGTKIDLSNIQTIKSVELEKAKGLAIALQREVDTLEQERLKLKEALRLQALNRGERAVAMGLGVEELTAVEEYAAKLRGKDESSPSDVRSAKTQRPVLNNAQLEKLTIELERVHVEAAEAREKCDATERDLRKVQAENRALDAVVKEVSVTLIKTRGRSGTPAPPESKDGATNNLGLKFPVIEKLLHTLEKKRHKDLSNDLYGNDSVEDHVIQVNQSLREELMAMSIRIEDLESQVATSQKLAENSQRNAEALRMRAMKARGKVLELPTELLLGSVHDYSSVVEQLVECLMELQVKDKELRTVRSSLEKFESHYASLAGRQRHLYRDYHIVKKESAAEIDALKNQVKDAEIERDSQLIRVEELEKLLKAIHERTEWNHTQRSLVESQRSVAVLRVNEINLKRKYLAVADLEMNIRKENTKLKTDLMALDRVARETISRLQISKAEALRRVEALMASLEDSVPKSDFSLLQNKLDLYVSKTKLLLDREQTWIADREQRESDAGKLAVAEDRIKGLEIDLYEAQKLVSSHQESIKELEFIRNDIQAKARLSEAHERLIKLEVAQDVAKKRSEMAENKCRSLEANEQQLKDRLDSLEKSYLEAAESNMRLKESQIELRNALEGAVERKDHEHILKEHKEQKEAIAKVNGEVLKYKELADISSTQTADLLHLRSQDEKEKAILRATIQELQMEGDEKLLIGKLHHHILVLQMSESGVIRKLETQQTKCLRLENRVVKLERAVDERDANMFQVKIDARNSLRLLQKAVSDMRTRIVGQVTLDKHERTCSLVQSLDSRKKEMEDKIGEIEGQKRSLEDTIAEQEESLKSLSELIESLKDTSTASDRIISWQSRMATLQISNLRLSRDLDFQKHSKLNAEANLAGHMDRVCQLENHLCAAQIDLDDKQLEWEKRQEDMEHIIQQLEAEREQIFHAASLADLKQSLPDRSLPVSHQLEAALRMLVERSRLLTAQEIKISNLETKIGTLKEKLSNAGDRIQEREAHITELRIDVARNDLRNGEGFTEYGMLLTTHSRLCAYDYFKDSKTRQLIRRREGEAMKSAQEVINSLQRQLSKKDELVERYREMIKDRRKDMAIKEENGQAEIRNLTEVINTLNDRQVNKLKNPPEVPQQLLSTNKDLESNTEAVQELESMLKVKDEELATLRSKYSHLKQTHKHHLETSETEIHHLRHELSIRNASHHEYETQIEALKRDLHLNEKELALAAEAADEIQKSRGLQEHISKLNREIQKRDSKIGNMNEAIVQLKETLIKTAESVAEQKIRDSNENLASNAEQQGLGDLKRISHLESQVTKLTKTIEAHKKSEKALQDSVLKVTFELDKKERLVEKLQDQNKESQKALKKLAHASREKEHHEKESHSRSDSARRQHEKDGGDHLHHESDKGKRFAKLVEEEKKHAADQAKERWEAEKKLQKRVELMKSKLTEKTTELTESISREKSLKDQVTRLQTENSKLSKKLHTLSGLPAAAVAALEAQQHHHRREQEEKDKRHSDAMSVSWRESETSHGSSSRPSDATSSTRTTTSTAPSDEPNVHLSPDDPDLTPEEQMLRRRLLKTLTQLDNLQRENCDLEKSVNHWKRLSEVERLRQVKELKRENKRLKEQIEELESNDGSSSRRSSKTTEADDEDSSNDSSSDSEAKRKHRKQQESALKKVEEGHAQYDRTAKKGEKSAHVVPMLESRIKDLLQRIQDLEDAKFKVEQNLVEVKFDKEKAIAEAERMKRRAADMEDSMRAQSELAAARNAKRATNEIPGLNITYTQLRTSTARLLANKTKDELAVVIDHLSSAAEKLKIENEQFKKGTGGTISNLKYMEMSKEIKVLRKEKTEAIEVAKAKAVSDAQALKVEEENNKLRNQAKKDAEKLKKVIQQLKELEQSNEGLMKEVATLRRRYGIRDDGSDRADSPDSENYKHEERSRRARDAGEIAHLRGQLAEKDEIIRTLSGSDGSKADSPGEVRKLRREMEMWRAQCNQVKDQLAQYLKADGVDEDGYRSSLRAEANMAEMRGGLGEIVVERNALREKVSTLEQEIERLKSELSSFDGSFMNELEELKNKYRETIKVNIKYEEHIRRLCDHCGYSAERILSQPFRRHDPGGGERSREADQ